MWSGQSTAGRVPRPQRSSDGCPASSTSPQSALLIGDPGCRGAGLLPHRRVLAAPPRLQPINKGRGSRYGIRFRLNSRCSVSAIAANAAVTASQPAISIPAASSSSFLRAVYIAGGQSRGLPLPP